MIFFTRTAMNQVVMERKKVEYLMQPIYSSKSVSGCKRIISRSERHFGLWRYIDNAFSSNLARRQISILAVRGITVLVRKRPT